ncbi:acyl-CoA dehydrogenase family protein [Variovorax sp. RB2P76]|uniref:acyl-CoA dehydrogenase family protein n=1 Tax=Variovorax sp. RB2P76 TaxID=3443736 RepID=UPI003F462343
MPGEPWTCGIKPVQVFIRTPLLRLEGQFSAAINSAIDIEASKALIAMAVSEENPQRAALLAIQTKVACSETFVRVARKIASTFGGWGVQVDCPASQLMADSLAASSFSGANDTLRNAIASKIGL